MDTHKKQVRLYIDMDGVLTNLALGVCKLIVDVVSPNHYDREAWIQFIEHDWPLGEYNIAEAIRERAGIVSPFNDHDLWILVDKQGSSFWKNLEPIQGSLYMYHVLSHMIENVYILTCPTVDPTSLHGKLAWLHKTMPAGRRFAKYVLTPHKHLLAGHPGDILIDDGPDNLKRWAEEGGTVIRFPQRWNTTGGDVYITPEGKAEYVIDCVVKAIGKLDPEEYDIPPMMRYFHGC